MLFLSPRRLSLALAADHVGRHLYTEKTRPQATLRPVFFEARLEFGSARGQNVVDGLLGVTAQPLGRPAGLPFWPFFHVEGSEAVILGRLFFG
jgi:hypothetical protein